jgi:hypothetical protein
MAYRFEMLGKRLRHVWEKDCTTHAALKHAEAVARECARNKVYDEATILISDDAEGVVCKVPVPKVVSG